jgi:hypothetical protein
MGFGRPRNKGGTLRGVNEPPKQALGVAVRFNMSVRYSYLRTAVAYVSVLVCCGQASNRALQTHKASQDTNTKERPKACFVITRADVERVLGEPVQEDVASNQTNSSEYCTYTTNRDSAKKTFEIHVRIDRESIRAFENFRRASKLPGGRALRIVGIGDEAYWITASPVVQFSGASLAVLKKKTGAIIITYRGPNDRSILEAAKKLGLKGLERL